VVYIHIVVGIGTVGIKTGIYLFVVVGAYLRFGVLYCGVSCIFFVMVGHLFSSVTFIGHVDVRLFDDCVQLSRHRILFTTQTSTGVQLSVCITTQLLSTRTTGQTVGTTSASTTVSTTYTLHTDVSFALT